MIKSMTGFGHAEKVTSQCKITVELKSVNHRYLDLNIKMPRRFNMLEGQVRNLLKQYMQRGKVDVFITYEDYTSSDYTLKYNKDLAAEYLRYLNQMAEEFHLENDIRVTALSRYPEVLSMEEQSVDEEELWKLLSDPLKEACTKFVETRIREGNHLKEDLLAKLEGLDQKVSLVEERSPQVVLAYREKLEQKVHELLEDSQIDDNRIAAEVILFSDKICNDEETVRLHSHIHGMQKILQESEGIGRKMDFMAQEMNREANTIYPNSDLEISNIAIDLKTEIEKSQRTDPERRIEEENVARLINIGFGNVVNSQKIVAVVSPDAAPVKRMVQSIKGTRSLIDATQGRKTKAVIVTSDDYLVLSALQPETIARRFAEIYENEDKGETHE